MLNFAKDLAHLLTNNYQSIILIQMLLLATPIGQFRKTVTVFWLP